MSYNVLWTDSERFTYVITVREGIILQQLTCRCYARDIQINYWTNVLLSKFSDDTVPTTMQWSLKFKIIPTKAVGYKVFTVTALGLRCDSTILWFVFREWEKKSIFLYTVDKFKIALKSTLLSKFSDDTVLTTMQWSLKFKIIPTKAVGCKVFTVTVLGLRCVSTILWVVFR